MPELPEIAAYLHALDPRIGGAVLEGIRVRSVALLATWDPPLEAAAGKRVLGLQRLGKRIVIALEDDLFDTYPGARFTAEQVRGGELMSFPSGGHLWVGHHEDIVSRAAAFARQALRDAG